METTTLPRCNRRKYNNGTSNGDDLEKKDLCNGVGDIMTGMSRLGIGGHQSPGRYSTKEGECSVESCLNQFTALELMTGSNKVVCEACTTRERKVIRLSRISPFITISYFTFFYLFTKNRLSPLACY